MNSRSWQRRNIIVKSDGAEVLSRDRAIMYRRQIDNKKANVFGVFALLVVSLIVVLSFPLGVFSSYASFLTPLTIFLTFFVPFWIWYSLTRLKFLCPDTEKYLEPYQLWQCPTCDHINTPSSTRWGNFNWIKNGFIFQAGGTPYCYFFPCGKCKLSPNAFQSPYNGNPIDLGIRARGNNDKIAVAWDEHQKRIVEPSLPAVVFDIEKHKTDAAERLESVLLKRMNVFQKSLVLSTERDKIIKQWQEMNHNNMLTEANLDLLEHWVRTKESALQNKM